MSGESVIKGSNQVQVCLLIPSAELESPSFRPLFGIFPSVGLWASMFSSELSGLLRELSCRDVRLFII